MRAPVPPDCESPWAVLKLRWLTCTPNSEGQRVCQGLVCFPEEKAGQGEGHTGPQLQILSVKIQTTRKHHLQAGNTSVLQPSSLFRPMGSGHVLRENQPRVPGGSVCRASPQPRGQHPPVPCPGEPQLLGCRLPARLWLSAMQPWLWAEPVGPSSQQLPKQLFQTPFLVSRMVLAQDSMPWWKDCTAEDK